MSYAKRGLLLASLVLALDQGSKWYLLNIVEIARRGRIAVLPFFDLVMVWNHGISFGMFSNPEQSQALFLILMALGIVAVLLHWLTESAGRFASLAIGLILGGALGNVIDRAVYGAVADFFYFRLGSFYWPAFNVADAAICVGVALLCAESMLSRKSTSEQP